MQKGKEEMYIRLKKKEDWIRKIKKSIEMFKENIIIVSNKLKSAKMLDAHGKQAIIDQVIEILDKMLED